MAFDFNHIPAFIAAIKEEKPFSTFLRDRYFPFAGAFSKKEILVEFKDGDKKLAPFVAPRVGGVTVKRQGYTAKTFAPAYIAPKREMTIDDVDKKAFGEDLYEDLSVEDRESELVLDDTNDLDARISRREEWMAAQLLVNNSVIIEELTNDPNVKIEKEIHFYEGDTNDWIYTPQVLWDEADADILSDFAAMARIAKSHGCAATEALVGTGVSAAIQNNEQLLKLLDIQKVNVGEVDPILQEYGVAKVARLNYKGHVLDIFECSDEYEDENGVMTPYIPADKVIVTAPGCGESLYAVIKQLEDDKKFHEYKGRRVPLITASTEAQAKELRLAAAPLLKPVKKYAWITASVLANV